MRSPGDSDIASVAWWVGVMILPFALAVLLFVADSVTLADEVELVSGIRVQEKYEAVRLALEKGEADHAQALLDSAAASTGKPFPENYWELGQSLEKARLWEAALYCYDKVLNQPLPSGHPNVRRARQAMVRLVQQAVDVSRVRNGDHEASCRGFIGPVSVRVAVRNGRLTACQIVGDYRESRDWHPQRPNVKARDVIPPKIVEKQGLAGVDAVTGATISSHVIIAAAGRALLRGTAPRQTPATMP